MIVKTHLALKKSLVFAKGFSVIVDPSLLKETLSYFFIVTQFDSSSNKDLCNTFGCIDL